MRPRSSIDNKEPGVIFQVWVLPKARSGAPGMSRCLPRTAGGMKAARSQAAVVKGKRDKRSMRACDP